MKAITIIGATGTLGSSVAKTLIQKGVQVKAIVRDIEKAKKLLPVEVELVYGDVSKKETLVPALKGTKTLYSSMNTTSLDASLPYHTEREGTINLVDAAVEAGVEHFIQLAGIELLHPEFASKGMEYKTNVIRKVGMDYAKASVLNTTYFHASMFLDTLPTFIENGTFAIIGNHVNPIHFTNTLDLADLIFNTIENKNTYNKSYSVQAKESFTMKEVAEKFLAVYDPSIEIITLPLEVLSQMGLPKEQEIFLTHMLSFAEQLKESNVAQETYADLGEPSQSIESFTKTLIQ